MAKKESPASTNSKNIIPVRFFKHCFFCSAGIDYIDHKNVELLNKFIAYNGKILPRRVTGTCAKHQHAITNAIKRARLIGLIPFVRTSNTPSNQH